jgi:hypothetical protein
MKFLVLSNDHPETLGTPPTPEQFAAIGAFMEEADKAGVVYLTGAVRPSEAAVRISYADGTRTVSDGPYAQAKDLLAGFAILDVPSCEDAVAWVSRFAEVAGVCETEIREVFLYGAVPLPVASAALA